MRRFVLSHLLRSTLAKLIYTPLSALAYSMAFRSDLLLLRGDVPSWGAAAAPPHFDIQEYIHNTLDLIIELGARLLSSFSSSSAAASSSSSILGPRSPHPWLYRWHSPRYHSSAKTPTYELDLQ